MLKLMSQWLALSAIATLSLMAPVDAAPKLSLEIFVSEPAEINVTSALIMGPNEMMVVSAQATRSSAERLAARIKSKGLRLKYIFLTHPHLDHSQGAGILLQHFPEAQFIATPAIAKLQRHRMALDDAMAKKRYGDNAAIPSVPAQDYRQNSLLIDGETVEIWHNIVGDAGIGHHDEPHVALYIPSLKALMPSDVIYFNAHVMMGGSTRASRQAWLKQIEGWMAMDLNIVVPGHMPKGAPLTAEGALTHTFSYITAYDSVLDKSDSSDAVIDEMINRYPDMPHRSALYLGTYLNFGEMHRLTFNPTIETIADWLPNYWVKWLDQKIFASKKADYNPEPTTD